MKRSLLPVLPAITLALVACRPKPCYPPLDEYTVIGPRHMVEGYAAQNADGTVNVIVEIPTGTTAKWEVDKTDGSLRWEIRDGEPRVVKYLGYPGNYGMVPRTLLDADQGGDGDPLDVLVIGDPVQRGELVRVRLLGVLHLLDGGEVDDKLIGVLEDHPFAAFAGLDELGRERPGITTILETWFTSYKGPGKLESQGFGDAAAAQAILDAASATYGAR